MVSLWAITAASLAAALFGCWLDVIAVSPTAVALDAGFLALVFVSARWFSRSRFDRLATPLDCFGISWGSGIGFGLLQYPLARSPFPLADKMLAVADRVLGFDWLSHFHFVVSHPWLLWVLEVSYLSYLPQAFVLAILVAFFAPDRARKCVLADFIVLAICFAGFLMVPAEGAGAYSGVGIEWDYVRQFLAARSGALHSVDVRHLDGIIQFPSYHAAMAVIMAYGFLAFPRYVAVPLVALDGLMLFSALAIGGHHLVDVLAGTIAAVAAIAIAERASIVYWFEAARLSSGKALGPNPRGGAI